MKKTTFALIVLLTASLACSSLTSATPTVTAPTAVPAATVSPAPSSSSDSSSFKFGLNAVFTDLILKKILADPSRYSLYAPLFAAYHIDHLRYPGGIPVRYYFWDDDNLSDAAIEKLAEYYLQINGKRADEYSVKHIIPQAGNYEQFLKFAAAAGIHPIIQLNTTFYHDGDTVYQTEPFSGQRGGASLQADRWAKIQANLEAQLDFTHAIFPGNLIWELGNEDNALLLAQDYGDVIIRYTNIIKAKYPADQVIAALSAGNAKTERKGQWNEDLVAYLVQNNFLSQVDYFAPHYYYDTRTEFHTQAEIDTRIKSDFFGQYLADMKSNFSSDSAPKFFVTEFAVLLHANDNADYNTQLHAMLMWDELLKFHGDPSIVGVTKLGFTPEKNALFFDQSLASSFDYINQNNPASDVFAYIPPEAETVRIFYETTGADVLEFSLTDGYEMLVTQTGRTKYIQALNYTETEQTLDLSKYGSGTYVTYTLPSLYEYHWNAEENKTAGSAAGQIAVPAHSFTVITISAP